MNAASDTKNFADFKVADLALADWGRKEIAIAETEMPGLMAIREEFAPRAAAARRAHRRLAAHDDPDRGADRDAAGARRRGALGVVQHLSRRRTTPPRRSPRAARRCSRTRASRSTSTGTTRTASSSGRATAARPNMILDDGGDATLLVHLGTRAETDRVVHRASRRARKRPRSSPRSRRSSPRIRSATRAIKAAIKGVTEETTTGVQAPLPDAQGRPARLSRRSTSTTR